MTMRLPRLPMSIDPLIGEARQRARRRRLFLAALLAGVVALAAGLSFGLRHTGPRLEAFRSSSGRWIPAGVEEIDVRAPSGSPYVPPISIRVTDPSQVKQIVEWFNGLTADRPGSPLCAGGNAATVSLTFRRANGVALARANSSPLPTGSCDPVSFKAGAKPDTLLFDPSGASSFITRVRQLLGISRMFVLYRG
jgi:hypothetical protein